MRKFVWIVPWLLAASLSCTSDKDKSAPPAAMTAPEAEDPVLAIDDANHSLTVTDAAGRELSLRIDTASRVQYLDCGDFHVQAGPGFFLEWTSRDYLAIEFEDLGGGRRIERYNFNGRVLELEMAGQPTEAQRKQFLDFYEADPALNTLEGNPDGAAMAGLLERAGPLLVAAMDERDPERCKEYLSRYDKDTGLPPIELRPPWADVTCGVASVCAAIKCYIGGLANWGCALCTYVKIVCAIMDMIGWT
jgi:hypothetical protein